MVSFAMFAIACSLQIRIFAATAIGTKIFSFDDPLYLPSHSTQPDGQTYYIPDVEVEFDIILHDASRTDIGVYKVFGIGTRHDYMYRYPLLLVNSALNDNNPGQVSLNWRTIDGSNSHNMVWNFGSNPPSYIFPMEQMKHIYFRCNQYYMYFEVDGFELINNTHTFFSVTQNDLIKKYDFYVGGDGERHAANATVSNFAFYSVNPVYTLDPSPSPTSNPSYIPTTDPSISPTITDPSISPTTDPSISPTNYPSISPTSKSPTKYPTISPTDFPTKSPSTTPTYNPSKFPTQNPSTTPTYNPSKFPTYNPSKFPTQNPSTTPTEIPTNNPSQIPTKIPTNNPTQIPTEIPTNNPTQIPKEIPTNNPTQIPILYESTQSEDEFGLTSTPGINIGSDTMTMIVYGCIIVCGCMCIMIVYTKKNYTENNLETQIEMIDINTDNINTDNVEREYSDDIQQIDYENVKPPSDDVKVVYNDRIENKNNEIENEGNNVEIEKENDNVVETNDVMFFKANRKWDQSDGEEESESDIDFEC